MERLAVASVYRPATSRPSHGARSSDCSPLRRELGRSLGVKDEPSRVSDGAAPINRSGGDLGDLDLPDLIR